MVMDRAAVVQFSVLATLVMNVITMAVRQAIHMIVMVAIGFSMKTALLKLINDLEGVLVFMILIMEVVVVVVWHMTMWHERCMSMRRDVSAKKRMRVSEGAICERTAMST